MVKGSFMYAFLGPEVVLDIVTLSSVIELIAQPT